MEKKDKRLMTYDALNDLVHKVCDTIEAAFPSGSAPLVLDRYDVNDVLHGFLSNAGVEFYEHGGDCSAMGSGCASCDAFGFGECRCELIKMAQAIDDETYGGEDE